MTMYLPMNLKVFAIVSAVVLTVGMLASTNFIQPVMAKDNPTKDNPTKDNPTKDNPTLVPGNATNSTSAGLSADYDCSHPEDLQPAGVEICRRFDTK
jgi:hypothetical protein